MAYSFDIGMWNKVFCLPKSLIEKHIKLCSLDELKFILWLFANPEKELESETIEKETGIKKEQVEDCIYYWIQAGLIKKDGDTLSCKKEDSAEQTETPTTQLKPVQTKQIEPKRKMLRPDSLQIAKRLGEDENLRHLFGETESIMGKTLSPTLSAVLLIAYDDYCLPCEVIMMITSFCVSRNKATTAHIEFVIKKWYNEGVTNLSMAEEKIKEMSEKRDAFNRFASIIELNSRMPSEKEEEMAFNVVTKMAFSDEMIKRCYDICIDNIGKYQYKYMQKIFEDWNRKGIKTLGDIEAKDKENENRETSYDIEQFHSLSGIDNI